MYTVAVPKQHGVLESEIIPSRHGGGMGQEGWSMAG